MDNEPVAYYSVPPVPISVTMKHSGLGIASFAVSIFVGILIFLMIIIAGIMETASPGGIDEESPAAIILGMGIIGLIMFDMVAFGLGIAGLFQKHRKKVFAVLGVIFSATAVFGTIGLVIIGMMAG